MGQKRMPTYGRAGQIESYFAHSLGKYQYFLNETTCIRLVGQNYITLPICSSIAAKMWILGEKNCQK